MPTPVRLQRSRRKGSRLVSPNGLPNVCVSRPSVLGNPFTPEGCREAGFTGTDDEIIARCVGAFKVWLGPHWRNNWDGEESERRRAEALAAIKDMKGKNAACWCELCPKHRETGKPWDEACPDCKPCHADPILEMANKEP